MKTGEYTIKDALGIHARPGGTAGQGAAGKFASKIMIASPEKSMPSASWA